jgi:hypothetical protein
VLGGAMMAAAPMGLRELSQIRSKALRAGRISNEEFRSKESKQLHFIIRNSLVASGAAEGG